MNAAGEGWIRRDPSSRASGPGSTAWDSSMVVPASARLAFLMNKSTYHLSLPPPFTISLCLCSGIYVQCARVCTNARFESRMQMNFRERQRGVERLVKRDDLRAIDPLAKLYQFSAILRRAIARGSIRRGYSARVFTQRRFIEAIISLAGTESFALLS